VLWHKDNGWYISTAVGEAAENQVFAWCKDSASGLLPDVLHVPFWAKKPCKVATISPYHTWSVAATQLYLEQKEQNEQGSGAAASSDAAVVEPPASKGKGGGKANKDAKSTKTGWLNRCVPLVQAVLAEDWEEAKRLAADYAGHPSLTPLLK